MIQYDYTVDIKRFKKRLKSDLQHKLRVALKCYTVFNFQLNEEEKTFTFHAKFRQYTTKKVFIIKNKEGNPKLYSGRYDYEQFEGGTIKVNIIIN